MEKSVDFEDEKLKKSQNNSGLDEGRTFEQVEDDLDERESAGQRDSSEEEDDNDVSSRNLDRSRSREKDTAVVDESERIKIE